MDCGVDRGVLLANAPFLVVENLNGEISVLLVVFLFFHFHRVRGVVLIVTNTSFSFIVYVYSQACHLRMYVFMKTQVENPNLINTKRIKTPEFFLQN